MRAGGNANNWDLASGADDLTVVLARERFAVIWTRSGLQLSIDAGSLAHAELSLTAAEARQLADLLGAAADFEGAA